MFSLKQGGSFGAVSGGSAILWLFGSESAYIADPSSGKATKIVGKTFFFPKTNLPKLSENIFW